MNDKSYYCYVWVADNAPYYVGKGKGQRAWHIGRSFGEMKPNTKIVIFRDNLKESHALRIEDLLVEKWGRKGIDAGGILENRARPSQDWPHGDIPFSEEHRKNLSKACKGNSPTNKGKKRLQVAWNKGMTKKEMAEYKRTRPDKPYITKKKTGYIGVARNDNLYSNKYKARCNGIFLGHFATPEEAAIAYNERAIEIYGDKAKLNEIK